LLVLVLSALDQQEVNSTTAGKLSLYAYNEIAGLSSEWPTSVERTETIVDTVKILTANVTFWPTPMGRRRRSRLVTKICSAINGKHDKLQADCLSSESLTNIQATIMHVKLQIQASKNHLSQTSHSKVLLSECFMPERRTFDKKQLLFCMMPLYSYRNKYIEIDNQTLHTLARKSCYIAQTNDDFLEIFNFKKVRAPDR
jgi:hypothetical protein